MDDAAKVMKSPRDVVGWLFDSGDGTRYRLIARWIFLRSLAAIYFSAFFSLAFQIKALIGPNGILPARQYLSAIERAVEGAQRFWYAPSLFWISSSSAMLMVVTWLGLVASVLAFFNLWPRLKLLLSVLYVFSLVWWCRAISLRANPMMACCWKRVCLLFCSSLRPGVMPGWGASHPPSRASLILLLWEWFRIYFESGMVKLLSGDPQDGGDFTARWTITIKIFRCLAGRDGMWAIFHDRFHAATTGGTLLIGILRCVADVFSTERRRIVCFLIVTPWEDSSYSDG